MPIRRLSPELVNQIAAGEVVERPASVVKELLENAFDADATRVDVEIEGGGRDLIRVSDDGTGMPPEDLPLAIESHATSKVAVSEDLEAIETMGFRGEALASIAAVSRFSIESRVRGAEEAWRLEVVEGVASPPRPVAGPVGTRVEVRHLFQVVPARRRFLKSETAETARIAEIVRQLALTRPTVAFRLVSNGRTLVDLPVTDDPVRRILGVLGTDLERKTLQVHGEIGDAADGTLATVWGVVGLPETARPTSKQQHLVLNGRAIVDRSLSHALKEGFRGLVDPGRFPVGVLHLHVDPGRVDVNVHPAKTEVRFRDARPLHGLVRQAVRSALVEADLARDLPVADASGSEFSDRGPTNRPSRGHAERPSSGRGEGRSSERSAVVGGRNDVEAWRAAVADVPFPEDATVAVGSTQARSEEPAPGPLPVIVGREAVLQVHDSYLVTQDESGIVVIDQHALHERVMFEKLQARMSEGPLESQRQLVPIVMDAEPSSVAAIESLAPLLARLGIDAAPAGPRGIAIHGFPSLLISRRVDPGVFVSELLERAAAGDLDRDDDEAALSEILDMMSCKAAVKAGDHLRPQEIAELLAMRDRIDRGASCPHGRPTHLRIPLGELERRFGRSSG